MDQISIIMIQCQILFYKSSICHSVAILIYIEMEFKEFEPQFKSAKTRFKFSAGLNLEAFDTFLSGTNQI